MIPGAHLELLRLTRLGFTPENISVYTGIPAAAIRVILASPLGKAELVRAS